MHLPIVTGIIFMFQTVNDAHCESNRLQASSHEKPQRIRKNISENVLKAKRTFLYTNFEHYDHPEHNRLKPDIDLFCTYKTEEPQIRGPSFADALL